MTRPCSRCGGPKPRLTPRTRKRYPYSWCPRCRSKHASGWSDEKRDRELRRKYGIGLDDFNRMLAQQGGRCAICGSTAPRGRGSFAVDHDHQTSEIRGLLCHPCNAGVGQFGDSPGTLRLAAAYLEGERP